MRKQRSISDFFMIAGGRSTTQVRAIAGNIVKELKNGRGGIRPWHVEGERESLWILLDYGDVVAHIFHAETRKFYNLERLWRKAPQRVYRSRRRKKRAQ